MNFDWMPIAQVIARTLPPHMVGSQRFCGNSSMEYKVVDTRTDKTVYQGGDVDKLDSAVKGAK